MRGAVATCLVMASGCSLLTDLSSLGGPGDASDATTNDGAIDAAPAPEAAANGFVLTIAPAHLTMDPGDAFPVAITLTRGVSFAGAVSVTVNGQQPPYLVASTTTIAANSGSVTISLPQLPAQTDYVLEVFGTSLVDATKTSSASLGVHIGSLVKVATADTTVVVPSFALSLDVKAWGAGGGGNETYTANGGGGGSGGGGGFASALIAVTPNESLALDVGGGGPVGGGGGYSAMRRGSTMLVIAGGGGGASATATITNAGCSSAGAGGKSGAGGGGASGQALSGAGGPGTQTAGGAGGASAAAGTSLHGGNGGTILNTTGGAHGGGGAGGDSPYCSAGGGGGGGGGGWFGGGGGGYMAVGAGGGGGGGSGYVEPSAGAPSLVTSTGSAAANASDPDRGDAGAGGAGGTYTNCNPNCTYVPAVAGGGGRVVVRLPKP